MVEARSAMVFDAAGGSVEGGAADSPGSDLARKRSHAQIENGVALAIFRGNHGPTMDERAVGNGQPFALRLRERQFPERIHPPTMPAELKRSRPSTRPRAKAIYLSPTLR